MPEFFSCCCRAVTCNQSARFLFVLHDALYPHPYTYTSGLPRDNYSCLRLFDPPASKANDVPSFFGRASTHLHNNKN
jgi:hypothetical protein